MSNRAVIGDAPLRREDQAFLTGRGRYLDDLDFPGLLHAVVLRSPHPHAEIAGIDATAARAAPGVAAVLTAAEVARDGLGSLEPSYAVNVKTGEPLAYLPQPLLATGKTRYAGEAVAVIVAATPDEALDAAELVAVDYRPLPAVADAEVAVRPGAPEVASEVPGNLCLDWRVGDTAAVTSAIAAAAHVVTIDVDNHRVVTNPMEPRGAVGTFDPVSGRYALHVSSQNVHGIRDHIARILGVAPTAVRLVAPDVGGNFGAKNFVYAEYALMAWAARLTGRPVKWIASRSEVFLADHQARDHRAEATLALDAEGRFLALKVDSLQNVGAYMMSAGGVQTFQYIHLPGTVYRIPALDLGIRAVLTNTTPIGVTRGPGFAEAVNIMERLIDTAARRCGFDRAALRRLNLAPATAMPFTNAFAETVDSGAFPETFERALAAADVAGFPTRRRESQARGRLRGLGFAYHIKGTGGQPHENAEVCFELDGTVRLTLGTHSVGQGHATTFPQILADRLGIPNEAIRFRQGDTDAIPIGGGSGSSRSTYMGGTAIWRAAEMVVEKAMPVAAEMLDAEDEEVRFEDGLFVVPGTNRSVALLDVAGRARAVNRPLDAYYRWTRQWMTFPNGTHVVEVEIDGLGVLRNPVIDGVSAGG